MRLVGVQRRLVGELRIDHHIHIIADLVELAVAAHLEMLAVRDRAEQLQPRNDRVEIASVAGGEKHDVSDHG